MFRGRHEQSVDEKGRMPFPARFREVLGVQGQTTLVLMRWFEPCIRAYPLSQWEKVEERLAQLPQFDPQVQRLRRMMLGEVAEVELDKQGRVLLPPWLRNHAKLEKDVLCIGMAQSVELWSPELWNRDMDQGWSDPALVNQVVANFGL